MSCCGEYYKKINDEWKIVKCHRACKENSKFCGYHKPKLNKNVVVDTSRNTVEDRMMAIPVNERFECIKKAVEMVIKNISVDPEESAKGIPGLMICGTGGIGKTHIVVETLKEHNLELGKDWWKNSGKISAFGVYQLLYEHKDGGIIVLDDSDLWSDKQGMNVLKAALDSYSTRIVSWNTKGADFAGLPRSFETKASVIFITNRTEKSIPQPIKDRCIYVPLKLTRNEIFSRMKTILPSFLPRVPLQLKNDVLQFLILADPPNLTFRTLHSAIKWKLNFPSTWKSFLPLFL